ncbi:MAG: ABC transporter permease subunit [Pseudomonadota bacterium]
MSRAIAAFIFLLAWEAIARAPSMQFIVASPIAITQYVFANAGLLSRALWTTTQSAALGFLWGNLTALFLAALVILQPRVERAVTILALVVFCLPLVATGPILRVIYGPGEGPQITLAALAVYYTSFLALRVGLRAVPQSWTDLMRSYGRGSWDTLVTVRMRASLPYGFAALQIAAPAAFLGAMVGEFTGAERGLGVLTLRSMRALDTDGTWTIALLATAVSMTVYFAIGALATRVLKDRPPLLLATPSQSQSQPIWQMGLSAMGLAVLVLVTWHGMMELFELNRFFAKRPADIWSFLVTGPNAESMRQTLWAALRETLTLTLPGYLAGLGLGAGLAMTVVMFPKLSALILPVAIALRSVPIITTAPLLILALGRGAVGTITIVAVMIFFPTLVACAEGLRQTPGAVSDLFRSYGAGRLRKLALAQIPAMLPAFFASARMAIPAGLLAVTTTEWLATGRGIGNLMALTASTSNYNMLWSATAALAVFALIMYLAAEAIERRVLQRYASEQTRP